MSELIESLANTLRGGGVVQLPRWHRTENQLAALSGIWRGEVALRAQVLSVDDCNLRLKVGVNVRLQAV